MQPTDPVILSPFGSSTALMYINLIVAGALLLESLLLWALLAYKRMSRIPVLLAFSFVALALSLASNMWSIYAGGMVSPHFPPEWYESVGTIPGWAQALTALLISLAGATCLLLLIIPFLPRAFPLSSIQLMKPRRGGEQPRQESTAHPTRFPRHDPA